jgi:hypothetical protein
MVELIARHRFADGGTKAFKFWFNSSAAVSVRALGAPVDYTRSSS